MPAVVQDILVAGKPDGPFPFEGFVDADAERQPLLRVQSGCLLRATAGYTHAPEAQAQVLIGAVYGPRPNSCGAPGLGHELPVCQTELDVFLGVLGRDKADPVVGPDPGLRGAIRQAYVGPFVGDQVGRRVAGHSVVDGLPDVPSERHGDQSGPIRIVCPRVPLSVEQQLAEPEAKVT